MSLSTMSNFINPQSSLCPTNGRQAVGDGAACYDNGSDVLAVCHLQGTGDMYYYSTTFSGGPGPLTFLRASGVFDTPKVKCPPDRGSSYCVTGSAAPMPPNYPNSISSFPSTKSPIPARNNSSPIQSGTHPILCRSNHSISTPPLTPDYGSDCSTSSDGSINEHDALDFLMTLFPKDGMNALPYAKRVSIDAPNLGADFDGVVLQLPGKPKTLYVDGKRAAAVNLRESIVALLDLADESLGCNALVISLERSSPNLSSLLHSLMYVGGTVVTTPPFKVDPAFVLVGLEI